MRHLLVPTDFSDTAYYAHETAALIARRTGAVVTLLHVIEDASLLRLRNDTVSARQLYHDFSERAAMIAREQMYRASRDEIFREVTVQHRIERGDPYTYIAEHVAQQRADLIVMGSNGAGGLNEVLVGSTAERVIRGASSPVLTLKEPLDPSEVRRVMLATDFSFDQTWFFRLFHPFFALLDARLHVVQISTPSFWHTHREARVAMDELAAQQGLTDYEFTLYNDYEREEGIHHAAEQFGAEVIAMATQGRQGIARMLNESLTERVANHTRRAIFTANYNANQPQVTG